jgi:hypothetical protein
MTLKSFSASFPRHILLDSEKKIAVINLFLLEMIPKMTSRSRGIATLKVRYQIQSEYVFFIHVLVIFQISNFKEFIASSTKINHSVPSLWHTLSVTFFLFTCTNFTWIMTFFSVLTHLECLIQFNMDVMYQFRIYFIIFLLCSDKRGKHWKYLIE